MDDLEAFGKLLDELMADGITLRAFMIQAALELARLHPNHEAWANEFITNLQARVSPNESQSHLVWRLARERIDALGGLLILLRQKFWRVCIVIAFGALQHGQRGRVRAIAIISRMRMVAIEFGMCRSGRKGGASGSVTAGYGKLREQSGGTWC
jgi:hypothetical protein